MSNDVPGAADRELVTTRVINAPRERGFQAWTDPDQLPQWWGPKGFTNTFYEFDLKPGGVWRYVMHPPGGGNFENESVFRKVVKPERIVFRHLSAPAFLLTATFADQAGKTKITWRMLFESAAEREKVRGSPSKQTNRTSTGSSPT